MTIKPSSRQFFWLFFIVGFFFAIFLWVSEYFSHQIFIGELERQISICSESSKECGLDKLISISTELLNANQAKIIELDLLIDSYYQSLMKTLLIFIVFLLIGCIPLLKDIYYEIRSHINLHR